MITCTLNHHTYTVDFVSGRAMREMEPAVKMYAHILAVTDAVLSGQENHDQTSVAEAMDVMVKWFCLVFGNQFTPDEVYDHYPADRLMHDVALTLMAVQTQTTEALSDFPTTPTAMNRPTA